MDPDFIYWGDGGGPEETRAALIVYVASWCAEFKLPFTFWVNLAVMAPGYLPP